MSTNVILTTGDLKQDYEILGPVYFQLSNRGGGLFKSSRFATLQKQYAERIDSMKRGGKMTDGKEVRATMRLISGIMGELNQEPTDFEVAFFIAAEEIKNRAALMGADAIICMRHDLDLDTTGFQFFYLQMYGTAVRIKAS